MESYLPAIILDMEQRINGIEAQLDTIENTQNVLEERLTHIEHLLEELRLLCLEDYKGAWEYRTKNL